MTVLTCGFSLKFFYFMKQRELNTKKFFDGDVFIVK